MKTAIICASIIIGASLNTEWVMSHIISIIIIATGFLVWDITDECCKKREAEKNTNIDY